MSANHNRVNKKYGKSVNKQKHKFFRFFRTINLFLGRLRRNVRGKKTVFGFTVLKCNQECYSGSSNSTTLCRTVDLYAGIKQNCHSRGKAETK